MNHWLFKSEAETWSWDDQVARGAAGQEWDGVRNFQARNHMKAMRLGDLGFFYHSGDIKAVVGVVEIIAEAHPDSTATRSAGNASTSSAVKPFPKPVSLETIKADPRLTEMVLVKNSRLSVQPVTPDEWRMICEIGDYKA